MKKINWSSNRVQLAVRFFGYGVVALATVLLTLGAVFYALGYRLDQNGKGFSQGGLVQFRSTPDGATVTIDGKQQSFKTPGRSNLTSGTHVIEMSLNGYDTWRKTINLQPGQLLWLNYTRFIPNAVSTNQLHSFASMAATLSSPDHKWLAMLEKSELPIVSMADLSDSQKSTITDLALPESQVTKIDGSYGKFTLLEWDPGSHYVIVKQQNRDVTSYIRVDRTNVSNTINISKLFGLGISDAHFGSNSNTIFVRTGDVLRRLDMSNNSSSAALATGVSTFGVYAGSDIAYYVANDASTSQRAQLVGIYSGNKVQTIRSYPLDKKILVTYAEYFGHSYLAVHSDAGIVQILRDPISDSKDVTEFAHINLGQQPKWLKFSPNGRMLVAGSGNDMATYDIEVAEEFHVNIGDGADVTLAPQWLDDYHLWTDAGGRLRVFEFDGANDAELTSVAEGQAVVLSQDGKRLYSISHGAGQFTLQSSKLAKD